MPRKYGNSLDLPPPKSASPAEMEMLWAKNLKLLFQAYGAIPGDPSCLLKLALGLAYDYVPAFSKTTRGAPEKWDFGRRMTLFQAVEEKVEGGHSASNACTLLAKTAPFNQWGPRGEKPKSETLRRAYAKAKKDKSFVNLMMFARMTLPSIHTGKGAASDDAKIVH
jgi:hypothetical protein